MDAVEWSNFYAFDVMGAVGFGKSWGMLESGEMHEAISQLHSAMVPLGVLGPVPWLLRLATDLPGANKAVQNFMDWCWNQLSEKKKVCVLFRGRERLFADLTGVRTLTMKASQRML